MQIQQVIGGVDHRPQRAGARQLGRLPRPVERREAPQAVEILVDIARGDRIARVEFAIGGDIVEGERQLAAARPELGAEQRVERDRAADLVAVGQRADDDVRPGSGPVRVVT
jgi:hypothetical protein